MTLGECFDYDGLRALLRARAEQLDISRLEIDRLSGLPNGYAGTVLSESGRKHIGPSGLGPLMTALGVKLAVIEDPEAMAPYTARAARRAPNVSNTDTRRLGRNVLNRAKLAIFAELGRRGGLATFAKLTDAEKTERGRRAVSKRWERYRARQAAAGG